VAIENTAQKLGWLRLRRISDAAGATWVAAVTELVTPKSAVETDG